MKYIPFRKRICSILKKMLSAIEKTHLEYTPIQDEQYKRSCCMVNVVGNETGEVKTRTRVFLLADELNKG